MRIATRIRRSPRSNEDPGFEETIMTRKLKVLRGGHAVAVAGLCLLLALSGCGLDEVEIPELSGPSELALSVKLTAIPDILTADGFSTSLIQVTLRNENGQPVAGRLVFLAITDALGRDADIGLLRSTGAGGIGTGLSLVTGSNGIAQAAYEAPVRTDFTANGTVLVVARPIADDANGQIYREVRIELRTAEPRLFPEIPGNPPPTCGFTVEPGAGPYRVNQTILFQSTATDRDVAGPGQILRYEWFFGDGTTADSRPDTAKVYRFPGNFTVTHVVTDNGGSRVACGTVLPVIP